MQKENFIILVGLAIDLFLVIGLTDWLEEDIVEYKTATIY